MDRIRVSSSNVASVGYDESTSTLEVEFHNGGIYQYFGVPVQHFVNLTNGIGSVGEYLGQYVKGSYRYRKIG